MTSTLVRKTTPTSRPLAAPFGSDFLGVGSLLDRMLPYAAAAQPRLMRSYRQEDGSQVLEFNLAGFKEEELSVKLDTALHELVIRAERTTPGREERFATSVAVSPYTSPEDIALTYDAGVLTLTVAPLEKRQAAALVDLPLTRASSKEPSADSPVKAEAQE